MVHKIWQRSIEILGSSVVECHTFDVQFCRIELNLNEIYSSWMKNVQLEWNDDSIWTSYICFKGSLFEWYQMFTGTESQCSYSSSVTLGFWTFEDFQDNSTLPVNLKEWNCFDNKVHFSPVNVGGLLHWMKINSLWRIQITVHWSVVGATGQGKFYMIITFNLTLAQIILWMSWRSPIQLLTYSKIA